MNRVHELHGNRIDYSDDTDRIILTGDPPDDWTQVYLEIRVENPQVAKGRARVLRQIRTLASSFRGSVWPVCGQSVALDWTKLPGPFATVLLGRTTASLPTGPALYAAVRLVPPRVLGRDEMSIW